MKQNHIVEPNKKVTAVEWLIENVNGKSWWENVAGIPEEIIQQAKAMEKEQIAKAWNDGDYAYFYSKETGREFDSGEQYYNETYKSKDVTSS